MRKYIKSSVDSNHTLVLQDDEAYDVLFGTARECHKYHSDISKFITDAEFVNDTFYDANPDPDTLENYISQGLLIDESNEVYIPAGTHFTPMRYGLKVGNDDLDWTHFDGIPIKISFTDLGLKCYYAADFNHDIFASDSADSYRSIVAKVLELSKYFEIS